jgi:HK97 family phage major capsid protein
MKTSMRDAILRELKAARDIADLATGETRDLSTEERAKVAAHIGKAAELKKSAEEQDALSKQLSDLTDGIGLHRDDDGDGGDGDPKPPAGYNGRKGKSVGQAFTESTEYKAMLAGAPNGKFSEKARVQSQPYGVKDLLTGGDTTDSAGTLVQTDRRGLQDPFYQRPLTVRDLVTKGTTASDTIEYVRLVSVTNNAAPVAEATSSALATADGDGGVLINAAGGGYKPESAMVFEKATATVKTIAHWLPATKRALSDAGQVRTLIDDFLKYGLEEELEDQMVSGNGAGENLDGIGHVSGVQTQNAPAGALTLLDTTRIARRKVRIGGRAIPTAYVMNPIDWETIELAKDGQDRYYGAGPFALTAPRLWGLPVVESEAIPQGTAYVGDWTKAILYDREQASIQVTDSHADFFIRNLVAILAELRVAFAVLRPAAFVKIDVA